MINTQSIRNTWGLGAGSRNVGNQPTREEEWPGSREGLVSPVCCEHAWVALLPGY